MSPAAMSPTDETALPDAILLDVDTGAVGNARDRRLLWLLSGLGLSLLIHCWAAASLSQWLLEDRNHYEPPLLEARLEPVDPVEVEDVEVVVQELANPDDREKAQQTAVNAMSLGIAVVEQPRLAVAPAPPVNLDPTLVQAPAFDVPEGMKFSDRLVVPGTTGESLIQLDAALDRVTWEIARHLQERKVLVVWLLDASGSLTAQRLTVQKRLKRIYRELEALEAAGQFPKQDQPLLSGVVAFGQSTQYLTPEPTEKFQEVEDAFSALVNDPSGQEHVFTAVSQVMDRWSHYRIDHGRRILLMTITDEAGDDHGPPLDLAIARCRRYGALAYVIGPASPFGKRKGYVPYVAPEDRTTYQLPVDLGPESVVVENVELPFWYNGPQHANLSSGFGPYALSRLVHETGGVYFMTNMTTMAGLETIGDYDPHLMKSFVPDYRYGSPQEFLSDMTRYPIRMGVFAAAQYSQTTNLKASGTPQLSFVLTPRNFRTTFTDAQKSVAITQFAVDAILAKFPANAEQAYTTDPSPRWRVAFDLNYGRLLAQKVRALEYNYAVAFLKGKYTDEDVDKRVNRVSLRQDVKVNYASGLQKLATKAEQHLRQVLEDAPGTPWAVLASRELQDGFGIRVVESYVAPPPPPKPNTNPAKARPRPKFAPEPTAPRPSGPPAPKVPPPLPKL